MATANDRAVLNMILNPLLPNEPFDPNANEPEDPFDALPGIERCRELEKSGVQAAEAGNSEQAIALFSQAIELCPGNPSPLNNRAQAYRLAEKTDEALVDLDKSIEISQGKGKAACQAYTQRAMIHHLRDHKDLAKADFQRAADLGSSFAKMQLVAMNPYAAMCNKMLAEVMGKLQKGEQ